MDRVFDFEIPVLHPLAVHFPIALLLAGCALVWVWSISGSRDWLAPAILVWLMGTLGALFAKLTGEAMEEQAEGAPMVEAFSELHELAANWTLAVSVTLLCVLVASRVHGKGASAAAPIWLRTVAAIFAIAAAILVAWTGHLGGVMVWGVPT